VLFLKVLFRNFVKVKLPTPFSSVPAEVLVPELLLLKLLLSIIELMTFLKLIPMLFSVNSEFTR